jgi:alpha-tubulin suppressor-like RCC1 family protein
VWRAVSRIVLIAAVISCGGGDSSGPDPIDPNSIEGQITALYPEGPTLRDAAMSRIAAVRAGLAQNNATGAKSQALSLVDLTLTSLRAGVLTGGKVEATRASASRLIDAIYQLVSLTPPAIPDAALTDDGAAKIVGPSGGTVATPNGGAGVQFPAGTLPQEVLVTIVRIPTPATPGTGPLPTTLKQYPPYYDFATTPAVVFSDSARVGICQVTDPSSPFYPPEPHDKLRLAHTVGPASQTTLEILDRVSVDDLVRCTSVTASATNFDAQFGWRGALASIVDRALDMVRPTQLFAAHGGLGGKTKSFSPFGAVDPTSAPVASVTVTISPSTIKVGEMALASAVLKDASGNVLTGRSVTWSAGGSNVVSVQASRGIISGDSPGTATITGTSEGKTGTATITVTPAQLFASLVTSGRDHTCALTSTAIAYCWGSNTSGQVGDGTTSRRLSPVAVSGGLTFRTLSAGSTYTCGLVNTSAYCWGNNFDGELGDGSKTNRTAPTPVAGGLAFDSIAAGFRHTCGLTSSGAAYCWGFNGTGELGNGTTVSQTSPVPVAGQLVFRSITVGGFHTCALTTGGAAYCWGLNNGGRVGDAGQTINTSPVPVPGGLTFQTIAAGYNHTCARTSTGVAYCWSYNNVGQLGDGTTTDRPGPVAVVGGFQFQALSAGYQHTCGLIPTGSAYCWGDNTYGQVGDATTTNRSSPVAVIGGRSFQRLAVGHYQSCGVTASSAVYCWGANFSGQLGDGTTTDRSLPVAVGPP